MERNIKFGKEERGIERKDKSLSAMENNSNIYSAREKRKLRELCSSVASHENILDLFWNDLSKFGVVGEKRLCKSIFVALTTRFFKHPVPVIIKGPPGAGKSFVPENVFPFFPKTAYYNLTSSSPKALIYCKKSFKNRFLVYCEAPGFESDFQDYLIRTLLSEGRIVYEVRGKRIQKEGPTGLITSTTRINLNAENESRCLTFFANDSPEQTKRILSAIAQQCNSEEEEPVRSILIKWRAFQKWLGLSSPLVAIPYAEALAKLINPWSIRLRRDFRQVLTMIKAHALIHQENRQRNSRGAIAATLKDYSAIYALLARPISEGLGLAVPYRIRKTVDAVKNIIERRKSGTKHFVLLTELAGKLEIDQSTAAYRLTLAVAKGYLKNLSGKGLAQTKIILGDPMPSEDRFILPKVEALRGKPKT